MSEGEINVRRNDPPDFDSEDYGFTFYDWAVNCRKYSIGERLMLSSISGPAYMTHARDARVGQRDSVGSVIQDVT